MAKNAIKYLDGIRIEKVDATRAEYEEYKQLGKRIKYKCPYKQNGKVCGAEMNICGGSEYITKYGTRVVKEPYFDSAPHSVHQRGCPNTPKGTPTISVYARAVRDISLDDYFELFAQPEREHHGPGGGVPIDPDDDVEPIEENVDEEEAAVRVGGQGGLIIYMRQYGTILS